MRGEERRGEGENHLPQSAGHAALDTAQGMAGFLDCDCTLPAHVEFFPNHRTQVPLHRASLNHFSAQPVGVPGIATTQV